MFWKRKKEYIYPMFDCGHCHKRSYNSNVCLYCNKFPQKGWLYYDDNKWPCKPSLKFWLDHKKKEDEVKGMPRHSFKCLECKSYILSNSHCDGAHCPGCGGPIVPIPYEQFKYGIRAEKDSQSKAGSLSINVGINTEKLVERLNIISKHTKALADELGELDNAE